MEERREAMPVATLVTVIDAFGIAAPLGSWMTPPIDPFPACAQADTAVEPTINSATATIPSVFIDWHVLIDDSPLAFLKPASFDVK
jgi:hypothetical protein